MGDFKVVKLVDAPVIINVAGGITPKGEYNALTAYVVGDMVSYNSSSYVATTSTTGNLPTNTSYWQLIAQGHTNEEIMDVIGATLTDSSSVDLTYTDGSDQISAAVIPGGVDHSLLANLTSGDPHTQYLLESAAATVATSGSHTDLSNIGTNTHAQIDTALSTAASHIADSTIHFTQASISIPSTQVSDFTEASQDAAASMLTAGTHDGISTSYNDAGNAYSLTNTDKGSSAVSTHVGLTDPHTQYHNDTRGDARYYTETELDAGQLDNRYYRENEHVSASAGAGDAGKPVVLDAGGQIDATMINSADVNHNATTNYVANEHINHTSVSISAGTGLSGGGDISANRTLNLADTAVTPASYGSASSVGTFTVDQQGRLTAASNTAISIASTAVSDFTEAAQDAIGAALTDTSSVDFTYNDGANTISAVVLPSGVDHNSLANLTTGDPHTQYVQAAGDTITGAMTWNKKAVQQVITQDLSVFRQFVADDMTAGALFTLTGEAVMFGWIHNASVVNTSGTTYDFSTIDEPGEYAQLYVFEESGKLDYYQSTNTSGTPTFTKRWGLDISTGVTDSGTNTYKVQSAVPNGASAVGFEFKSNTTLSNATSKLFSISNNGTESLMIGNNRGSFGSSNTASAGYCFGISNTSSGPASVAMGQLCQSTSSYAFSSGYDCRATGNGAVAMGLYAQAHGLYAASIGFQNIIDASSSFGIAIGALNTLTGAANGVAIGASCILTGNGVAIGQSCQANTSGLAIGSTAYALNAGDTAVGYAALAYGGNSFALGTQLTSWAPNSFACGSGVRNTIDSSFMFGTGSITDTAPGIFMSSTRSNIDTTRIAIARNTGTSGSTELVTNGNFSGNATGWTLVNWVYGTNNITKPAGADGTATQAISGLEIGKVYVLSYKVTFASAEDQTQYVTPSLTGGMTLTFGNRSRTMIVAHKEIFIATATTCNLVFTTTGSTQVPTLDDVSIKEVNTGQLSVAGVLYANRRLAIGSVTSTNLLDIGAGTTTQAPIHLTSGTAKTTPVAGDLEFHDKRLYFMGDGDKMVVDQSEASIISSSSVGNSTTETTLHTHTIAANELIPYRMITAKSWGRYSKGAGAHVLTIRLKANGSTLATWTCPSGSATNEYFATEVTMTCRTTGATGTVWINAENKMSTQIGYYSPASASTVDTTASVTLTLTAQWDTADAGSVVYVDQGLLNWRGK